MFKFKKYTLLWQTNIINLMKERIIMHLNCEVSLK